MTVEVQKQNGVVVVPAKKQRLAGVISATGKVEANADRIAHVSPRISGKIVAVKASLGDSVAAGQALAILDSVELGEALNRTTSQKPNLPWPNRTWSGLRTWWKRRLRPVRISFRPRPISGWPKPSCTPTKSVCPCMASQPPTLKGKTTKSRSCRSALPSAALSRRNTPLSANSPDPSKSLYTVADLSSVWVLVDINEKDLAKVRKGQSAIVTVGAFPDIKFRGRINHIADVVDQSTRTVKARIEVANPGRKLKPEMFASVELALPTDATAVLAVPEDAMQDLDGKKVVFVAENEAEFAARQVQAGRVADGMIEIVSGLKEGERYAVKGSFILKSEIKKGELVDEHGH